MTLNSLQVAVRTSAAGAASPGSAKPANCAVTWRVSIRNLTPTVAGTRGSQHCRRRCSPSSCQTCTCGGREIASHALVAVAEDAIATSCPGGTYVRRARIT